MSTPSRLAQVAEALKDWRTTKKTKFERIPIDLMNQVRGLRGGEFSDSEICKATGLAWVQLIPKPKAKKAAEKFVEIPPLLMAEPVVVEIHDGDRSVIIRLGPSFDVEKLISRFCP
jgi:hypothetical protein